MRWAEYGRLKTMEYKDKGFENVAVPHCNTLRFHLGEGVRIRFLLNESIVEPKIGEVLSHPDDVDDVGQTRTLLISKVFGPAVGEDDGKLRRDRYVVKIKISRQFNLLVKFFGVCASFLMAARLFQYTREESGIAFYGSCSDVITASNNCVLCAASL